jgi:cytochrome c556
MRANVETAADGVWAAQSAEKLSAADWLLAEQDATNVIASASFIANAGIGPKDKAMQANADYQAWAKDVQDTGIKILAAVKAKDQMAMGAAADHLSDTCQACHDKYRPQVPSDGVVRFPFYPARVIKP